MMVRPRSAALALAEAMNAEVLAVQPSWVGDTPVSACTPTTGDAGGPGMRLANTAHTARPWRIHEFMPDFRLVDVWSLLTPGGPDDFPRLVRLMGLRAICRKAPSRRGPHALGGQAEGVGELLGWDGPDAGQSSEAADAPRPVAGGAAPTLRPCPGLRRAPLHHAYLINDEWASEIVNRTVHGVMHIAGSATRRAATAARWAPWSSQTDRLGPATWPRSHRSGT